MGVMIFNSATDDEFLSCNWWNWRPTVELMRPTHILTDEDFDMLSNGIGELSKAHCDELVRFFEEHIFPGLDDHERILLSGDKTLEPDDFKFHRDDFTKNYSTTAPWLREFVTFLSTSDGVYVC